MNPGGRAMLVPASVSELRALLGTKEEGVLAAGLRGYADALESSDAKANGAGAVLERYVASSPDAAEVVQVLQGACAGGVSGLLGVAARLSAATSGMRLLAAALRVHARRGRAGDVYVLSNALLREEDAGEKGAPAWIRIFFGAGLSVDAAEERAGHQSGQADAGVAAAIGLLAEMATQGDAALAGRLVAVLDLGGARGPQRRCDAVLLAFHGLVCALLERASVEDRALLARDTRFFGRLLASGLGSFADAHPQAVVRLLRAVMRRVVQNEDDSRTLAVSFLGRGRLAQLLEAATRPAPRPVAVAARLLLLRTVSRAGAGVVFRCASPEAVRSRALAEFVRADVEPRAHAGCAFSAVVLRAVHRSAPDVSWECVVREAQRAGGLSPGVPLLASLARLHGVLRESACLDIGSQGSSPIPRPLLTRLVLSESGLVRHHGLVAVALLLERHVRCRAGLDALPDAQTLFNAWRGGVSGGRPGALHAVGGAVLAQYVRAATSAGAHAGVRGVLAGVRLGHVFAGCEGERVLCAALSLAAVLDPVRALDAAGLASACAALGRALGGSDVLRALAGRVLAAWLAVSGAASAHAAPAVAAAIARRPDGVRGALEAVVRMHRDALSFPPGAEPVCVLLGIDLESMSAEPAEPADTDDSASGLTLAHTDEISVGTAGEGTAAMNSLRILTDELTVGTAGKGTGLTLAHTDKMSVGTAGKGTGLTLAHTDELSVDSAGEGTASRGPMRMLADKRPTAGVSAMPTCSVEDVVAACDDVEGAIPDCGGRGSAVPALDQSLGRAAFVSGALARLERRAVLDACRRLPLDADVRHGCGRASCSVSCLGARLARADFGAWMRVLAWALVDGGAHGLCVSARQVVDAGLAGMAVVGLSLADADARRLCHLVLTHVHRLAAAEGLGAAVLHVLRHGVAPSLDRTAPFASRLGRVHALLLAEALPVALRPAHALWRCVAELCIDGRGALCSLGAVASRLLGRPPGPGERLVREASWLLACVEGALRGCAGHGSVRDEALRAGVDGHAAALVLHLRGAEGAAGVVRQARRVLRRLAPEWHAAFSLAL